MAATLNARFRTICATKGFLLGGLAAGLALRSRTGRPLVRERVLALACEVADHEAQGSPDPRPTRGWTLGPETTGRAGKAASPATVNGQACAGAHEITLIVFHCGLPSEGRQ
jgi:hypothetical protein